MTDFKAISSLIEEKLKDFETKFGDLEKFFRKHLEDELHNMDLEDSFLDPDLSGLENYENFLKNGN